MGVSQDGLIGILGRLEQIFQRLEDFKFIEVPPPQSLEYKTQEILLVVLSILTSVTERITQGRASKFILAVDIVIYLHLIRKMFEKVPEPARHRIRTSLLQRQRKYSSGFAVSIMI